MIAPLLPIRRVLAPNAGVYTLEGTNTWIVGSDPTFVIDPEGRLIAILDDHGWPEFLDDLLRQLERPPAHGAIDQQDIRR